MKNQFAHLETLVELKCLLIINLESLQEQHDEVSKINANPASLEKLELTIFDMQERVRKVKNDIENEAVNIVHSVMKISNIKVVFEEVRV